MTEAALKLNQQKTVNCEISRSVFAGDMSGLVKMSTFLSRIFEKITKPKQDDFFLNQSYFSPEFIKENPFAVFQIDPDSTLLRRDTTEDTNILSMNDVRTLVQSCVLLINTQHTRYIQTGNAFANPNTISTLLFSLNGDFINKEILKNQITQALQIIADLQQKEGPQVSEKKDRNTEEDEETPEQTGDVTQKVNTKIREDEGKIQTAGETPQTSAQTAPPTYQEILSQSSDARFRIEREARLLQITVLPQLLARKGLVGLDLETFARDYPAEYRQIQDQVSHELEGFLRRLDPEKRAQYFAGELDPTRFTLEVRREFLLNSNPALEGQLDLLVTAVEQKAPLEKQAEVKKQISDAKKTPFNIKEVTPEQQKNITELFEKNKADLQKLQESADFEKSINQNMGLLLQKAGVSQADQQKIVNVLNSAWARDFQLDFMDNITEKQFQDLFQFPLPAGLSSPEQLQLFAGSLKHWRIVNQFTASQVWEKDSLRQSGTQKPSPEGTTPELTAEQIRIVRQTEEFARKLGVNIDDIAIARSLSRNDLVRLRAQFPDLADRFDRFEKIIDELVLERQTDFEERLAASGKAKTYIEHPGRIGEIYTQPTQKNSSVTSQPIDIEDLEGINELNQRGRTFIEQNFWNFSDRDSDVGVVVFTSGQNGSETPIGFSPGWESIADQFSSITDPTGEMTIASGETGVKTLASTIGGGLLKSFISKKLAGKAAEAAVKAGAGAAGAATAAALFPSAQIILPALAIWGAIPDELKALPFILAGQLLSSLFSLGLPTLVGGIIGGFLGSGLGLPGIIAGAGLGGGLGGGLGAAIQSFLNSRAVAPTPIIPQTPGNFSPPGRPGSLSASSSAPFIRPVLLAASSTATAAGLVLLSSVSSSFLTPIGTYSSTGDISPYVTIVKAATPVHTGAKFDNPADGSPQKITYTISITPKAGYKLKVHELTDQFTFEGNTSKRTGEKDPTLPQSPVNLALLQTKQPPPAPAGQAPNEVILTPQTPIYFDGYDESFDKNFNDSNVTNTVKMTFDAIPVDASGTDGTAITAQTATTAEVLCFGECPQSQNGCWPFTGPIETVPYEKSHDSLEAVDLAASRDGLPVYATFTGSACYYANGDTNVYGNLIKLHANGFVYWYGHLQSAAAKPDGSEQQASGTCRPVNAGDQIGLEDSTSKNGDYQNSHLHYELRLDNGKDSPWDIPLCAHGGCTLVPLSVKDNGIKPDYSFRSSIPFNETLQSKVPDKLEDGKFVRSCYDKPGSKTQ